MKFKKPRSSVSDLVHLEIPCVPVHPEGGLREGRLAICIYAGRYLTGGAFVQPVGTEQQHGNEQHAADGRDDVQLQEVAISQQNVGRQRQCDDVNQRREGAIALRLI